MPVAPLAVNFPPETKSLTVPDGCRLEGEFTGADCRFAVGAGKWRECGFKEGTLCWAGNAGRVCEKTFLFVIYEDGSEQAANEFAATLRQRGYARTVAVSDEDV